MDELRSLVEDALTRTMASADGRAVIASVDAPNLYVQWAALGEDDGFHLEVSNPENQRRSLWHRVRQRGQSAPAATLGEEQIAALSRLGFAAGSPNYERYIPAGELSREEVADVLASALRETLGVGSPSEVTVEVL